MILVEELRRGVSIDELATALDGMSHAERLDQMYRFNGKDQAQLYEMAAGRTCSLAEDFIPEERGKLQEIIFWGKNSLPMFTHFQKRFCRPESAVDPLVAYGYNEQVMKLFTGPGYFIARDAKTEDKVPRVVVDYFDVPNEKVSTWPKILPNNARLSRFVYYQTRDWMWKVSTHVTIGRAKKIDNWMDNWFWLCRED